MKKGIPIKTQFILMLDTENLEGNVDDIDLCVITESSERAQVVCRFVGQGKIYFSL